jgi:hypothetical protein
MRRSARFGLAAVAVLLVLFGAYAAYWWIVAGRIRDGVLAWQQSETPRKIDASWQDLRVTGFPTMFRVNINDAVLRDRAWSPPPELHAASLSGSARPWDFNNWVLTAPRGLIADLAAAGERPPVKLTARSAKGTASLSAQGKTWLWLNLRDIAAEANGKIPIKFADAWITVPAKPPKADTDASFGLALNLREIEVAAPPVKFSHTLDQLALAVTVKGAMPDGPLASAVAAWRDAGGTIEVDNLRVQWGGLGVSGNGTLALDQRLQPIAAFSGGVEGFDTILNALVAADWLTPEQAELVQIALTALAKPGPDGKPQITAPFTIENGKMYLGPARLGAVPRIVWE